MDMLVRRLSQHLRVGGLMGVVRAIGILSVAIDRIAIWFTDTRHDATPPA